MENDIYFESIYLSYKTIKTFEKMYESKKEEIMNDLKKKIKEKYNIDINGSKLSEDTANSPTEYYHSTTG
tara:strand:- start:333 stop:542 length:210 start_codon:yes stop_codon:yes gene_type:complete